MNFVPETQMDDDFVDCDKPRKSFHWDMKKKTKADKVSPQTAKDDVLSDILNEMKQETDDASDIPSAIPKKPKLTSTPNCLSKASSKTLASAEDLETFEANEKFADDALMDIMGELKESLTKQNQLSAEGKKVGRPFHVKKPFCRKLNLGESTLKQENKTQNQSGRSTSNEKAQPNKSTMSPPKGNSTQTGLLSTESSQDSLDPLVAENKAGSLLMEDDSWMEDVNLDPKEKSLHKDFNLLSPYKHQKDQKERYKVFLYSWNIGVVCFEFIL